MFVIDAANCLKNTTSQVGITAFVCVHLVIMIFTTEGSVREDQGEDQLEISVVFSTYFFLQPAPFPFQPVRERRAEAAQRPRLV